MLTLIRGNSKQWCICCRDVATLASAMPQADSEQTKLTDRKLQSLKGAKDGAPYDVRDTEVRGLRVRVMGSGERTFVLLARFSKGANPTRRALGTYPVMTLAEARDKALTWKKLIDKGVDPAHEEARKRANTFASVAEDFIAYVYRQKLRTADVMERRLRETFIKEARWGPRAATDIAADDVKRIVRKSVEADAKYQAFHDFALIRRVFNWAIGTDDYGLQINPCDRLNTKDIIGQRHARDRVLTDNELRALWRATERLGYPYGPLYRLLTLTGLRLGEACGAYWSEIDMIKKEWTIPAARMKKTKDGAKPFVLPLTDSAVALLNSLPRFHSGNAVFSMDHGQHPLRPANFSDPKERLDALMLQELRSMAADPECANLADFVNHDIRRTVRTHLSALRVGEEVREAVLAHVRPGIKGVYDKHQYLDEKREALTLWNTRLSSIVEPRQISSRHGA
jgi:integrase